MGHYSAPNRQTPNPGPIPRIQLPLIARSLQPVFDNLLLRFERVEEQLNRLEQKLDLIVGEEEPPR